MSHTQIILLQGQHCMRCSPVDCLQLLIIHSFSGSSPLPSKGLDGPRLSSRNMTKLDYTEMTRRMNWIELNFDMVLSFASLVSLLLDRNTKNDLLPVQTCMRKAGQTHWEILLSKKQLWADANRWNFPVEESLSDQEGAAACWGTGTNHVSFTPLYFCLWKNFLHLVFPSLCQRRNFN